MDRYHSIIHKKDILCCKKANRPLGRVAQVARSNSYLKKLKLLSPPLSKCETQWLYSVTRAICRFPWARNFLDIEDLIGLPRIGSNLFELVSLFSFKTDPKSEGFLKLFGFRLRA